RPAYQDKKQIKNEFAMKLYNYDLKWQVDGKQVVVTELTLLD
ncbi:MAG: tRNA (N6-threonylcarbamoyladenosine(37)-N6)-methyltransferase TrmO, partial [Gammaproteobacteria bacterium]|nr:tRNA (N6-threonylcarbamoyladenosine(37)-N6)-methyltransferase TrmO [Gammaproteobacteria bacterium]